MVNPCFLLCRRGLETFKYSFSFFFLMKHDKKIVCFLLGLFFCAQIMGLLILAKYVDYGKTVETGKLVLRPLPFLIERPDVSPTYSFAYIMVGVLFATAIILFIIKYAYINVWRVWYLLSIIFCLLVALGAFFPDDWGLILAFFGGIWKVYRPNRFIHNITEIFVYGGLLVVFAPILNIFSVTMLLLLISCYDVYAVWKSKHMVKMARFLTETKTFAGLSLPYTPNKIPGKMIPESTQKVRIAVLGGGDIAFPLLFNSVVFQQLLLEYSLGAAFYGKLLIVPLCATAMLLLLFLQSKKGVFYPAMPFLSIGCFVGYGLVWLI